MKSNIKYLFFLLLVFLYAFDGLSQANKIDEVKVKLIPKPAHPQKENVKDSIKVNISFKVKDYNNLKKLLVSYNSEKNKEKLFSKEYTYWEFGKKRYLELNGIMFIADGEQVELEFQTLKEQTGKDDYLIIEGKGDGNKKLFSSTIKAL